VAAEKSAIIAAGLWTIATRLHVICRAIWHGPAPLFGRYPAALFGISLRLIHR